jgi:Ner family transcriptional regulator
MQTNWTRQRILFELRERGTSAADLAARNGLQRFVVYSAMERPYPKVHKLIAEAVGQSPGVIWPQFYDADGARRLIRRKASVLRAA